VGISLETKCVLKILHNTGWIVAGYLGMKMLIKENDNICNADRRQ